MVYSLLRFYLLFFKLHVSWSFQYQVKQLLKLIAQGSRESRKHCLKYENLGRNPNGFYFACLPISEDTNVARLLTITGWNVLGNVVCLEKITEKESDSEFFCVWFQYVLTGCISWGKLVKSIYGCYFSILLRWNINCDSFINICISVVLFQWFST